MTWPLSILHHDDQFGDFQVWVDSDSDGKSKKDELFTLAELGITSIDLSLTPTGADVENATDNTIINTTTFT